MLVTGCGGNHLDYSYIGDEDPLPNPITVQDEGKDDTIFYSDDYFKHRATRYNPHLATLSIYMAKYSMNPGNPDNPEDYYWYEHQSDRLAKFWDTIGFSNPCFNHYYYEKTSFDSIGIGCAQRKIKEGDNEFTVIACAVRSGGYFYEWENNVWLGDGSQSDMNHEGWYNAATRVINFIQDYLSQLQQSRALQTSQIKLWLSGFSRGGAVMNLAGGLLDNKLGMDDSKTRYEIFDGVNLKREDVMVYTFEAPQGANLNSKNNAAKPRDELYYNIFNIVNQNDLVTKVAMQRYGFTRFGIDKFITTKFFDPTAFDIDRGFTKALYADYDSGYSWTSDDFKTYGISYSSILTDPDKIMQIISWATLGGDFPQVIYEDTTKTNYDSNIVLDILIDRAVDNLGDRDSYCRNFQNFAKNLMHYMMPDCKGEETLSWSSLLIMAAIQALGYVVLGPEIGLITDLSLEEITGCSSAEVYFALSIAGDVFLEYPTEVISMCKAIGDVFENHSTQLNVIHAQAQDSYYVKYHNEMHPDKQIQVVKYRHNSEVVRFECKDINEAHIWVNGNKVVYVNQDDDGDTLIFQCMDGFAVGVYSYATYHRLELFVPSFFDFKYHFYDHSWAPWHLVKIVRWTYNTNENDNRTGFTIVDENYNCDSDVFEGNYEKDSDYESDLPTDLINTKWNFHFNHLDENAAIDINVDFKNRSGMYTRLQAVVNQDGDNTTVVIFYNNVRVALANSPDYRVIWINTNYSEVEFYRGDATTNPTLIKWVYLNATMVE